MLKKEEIMLRELNKIYPNAKCELNFTTDLELVIAVVLSAQCTDKMVNKVTSSLFAKYQTLDDYIAASLAEVEEMIKKIGLYRNKAKFIKQLTAMIKTKYGGEVPRSRAELITLPGVGRKTANVVLSVLFSVPAIAVDTHVERVTKRLGICNEELSVLQVEQVLMEKLPKEAWSLSHHQLVLFGRYNCRAKKPACAECSLKNICAYFKENYPC